MSADTHLDRALLEGRLTAVRQAREQRRQQHERLQAVLTENAAQIHVLNGREAELAELLALPDDPGQVEP